MWAVLNAIKKASKQLESNVPGGKDLSRKPSQLNGHALRLSKSAAVMTKIIISIMTMKK